MNRSFSFLKKKLIPKITYGNENLRSDRCIVPNRLQ